MYLHCGLLVKVETYLYVNQGKEEKKCKFYCMVNRIQRLKIMLKRIRALKVPLGNRSLN